MTDPRGTFPPTGDYRAWGAVLTEARAAWARLKELTECSADAGCDMDPMSPSDAHFYNSGHLRDAFIDWESGPTVDEYNPDPAGNAREIYDLVGWFFSLAAHPEHGDMYREDISRMALDMSLCPLHLVDYAICFDDDDPECAIVRRLFPNHDI